VARQPYTALGFGALGVVAGVALSFAMGSSASSVQSAKAIDVQLSPGSHRETASPAPWTTTAGTGSIDADAVRAVEDQVEQDRSRHLSEPRNHDWAVASETALRADLQDNRGVRIGDVSCRSETCIVTLEWPDYRTAFSSYRSLLTHHYSVNCRRRMGVPPPNDPGAPYEAELFFDCATPDAAAVASAREQGEVAR